MKQVHAVVSAMLLVACTRSSSPTDGAAGSSSASPTSTATGRPRSSDDDAWAASDARKPALLADLDPEARAYLAERVVKVTPEASSFLAEGKMFVVERTNRPSEPTVHHPSFFHLVHLPGKGARGLHGDADWDWLRSNARLLLDTEARRVELVTRYVDVLRSARTRYAWTVKNVDELGLLTSAAADASPRASSEADAAKARELLAKYQDIIKPLALPGDAGPWRGALFANGRSRLIVRVDVVLRADGTIALTDTVLEKDAPIPTVFP